MVALKEGEIALSPLPSNSLIPEEEDYLLTMADVAKVRLRAKLSNTDTEGTEQSVRFVEVTTMTSLLKTPLTHTHTCM